MEKDEMVNDIEEDFENQKYYHGTSDLIDT